MERKDWNRIGLAAAIVLVPGGFLLGAALAARRLRKGDRTPAPEQDPLKSRPVPSPAEAGAER